MNRRTVLLAFGLLPMMTAPGALRAQAVSDAEAQEFQRIISSQLQAFSVDDGSAAYAFAAPSIKQMFPSPEIFMSMVKQGYPPIYRRQSFAFGQVDHAMGGAPTQHVTIVDATGKMWTALYGMERQADGTWKIVSCRLVEAPAADA